MATETDEESSTLGPDEAFAVLGNETRMEILQTLAESNDSLPFSELRDRVGVSDSGQFNYHLDKLAGHFVIQTDDGYLLGSAGTRVIEAVMSGAMTDAPVMEPTRLDAPCPYCGAPIEVDYRDEYLLTRCTNCPGSFAGIDSTARPDWTDPRGTIGLFALPSAGFRDRSLRESLDAAVAWHVFWAHSHDLCPRCSAPLKRTVEVCEAHADGDGICEQCHRRHAVMLANSCPNCPHRASGLGVGIVLTNPEVQVFFHRRGVDWTPPGWDDAATILDYGEEVVSQKPFEGRFSWTVDGDELVVTIDDEPSVVDVTKLSESETS